MGIGSSTAVSISEQDSNANISQQYAGTCDISCSNSISNTDITLINSQIGGDVEVSQTCSVNGQCLFNNTQNAVADIVFKAANSTTASNAGGWLNGLANSDYSYNASYQTINENIEEAINQKCNIGSANSMNNVTIYAANSQIGGSLVIDQTNNAQGGCTLQSSMNATAKATGTSNNCSAAGKKAKKQCGGKGGLGIGEYLIFFAIAGAILMIVMMIARYNQGKKAGPAASK